MSNTDESLSERTCLCGDSHFRFPQTARWVEDPEDVYIKAKVVKKEGDKTSVETEKNTALTLPDDKIWEQNPPKFEKVSDSWGRRDL